MKRDLKTRENDTAYERKSDESSIVNYPSHAVQ